MNSDTLSPEKMSQTPQDPSDRPKLLVVDDDWNIRDSLKRFLASQEFEVDVAENAAVARRKLHECAPDLVILDVMMPGEDGLSLCRSIAELKTIPLILVSARSDDIDRIIGLEIGADDYLAKPFHPRELLARIRAILRRLGHSSTVSAGDEVQQFFEFDRWVLEVPKRRLRRDDGVVVQLSASEFSLLMVFMKNPRIVLSRERILDLSRATDSEVFDRSVDSQISRFRRKLERDPREPEIIKTVWGGGYMFDTSVRRI